MNLGGVMITNNADHHPAETWASTTAAIIFAVDNNIEGSKRIAAMMLQAQIAQALVPFFQRTQEDEATKLQGDENHHTTPLAIENAELDEALKVVIETASGSPFADQFKDDGELHSRIWNLLGEHLTGARDGHRMAHRARRGLPQHMHPADEWMKGYNERMARERQEVEAPANSTENRE